MTYPVTPFGHLQRLTDNIGLVRHAEGVVPLHQHGYYVDDVARGLLVVCREPSPPQELIVLGRRYLYFLAQAQSIGGKFRDHLGYDRQWHDQPGTEDGWGRSLWALGTAAVRGPTNGIREESFTRFCRGARVSSPSPRAMAFAALGAAEILEKQPGHPAALALLYRASLVIGAPAADAAWPWPEPRLSYANGAMAAAVILSGRHLADDRMLRSGLRMLEWLLTAETRGGHLSVVSPEGWGRGESRPASDQRPAEVAALADACMCAATVTGDGKWLAGVEMSVAWFLGDNDAEVPLLDERTGGCSDSLTGAGRSRNQGAESTLAMISVLQHGHRMLPGSCAAQALQEPADPRGDSSRRARSPRDRPDPFRAGLERADLLGLGSLRAADGRVLDPLVVLQAAVTVGLDGGVVDEDVRRAVIGGDEAVAFVRVEPFHCSLSHCALLWDDRQDPRTWNLGCATSRPAMGAGPGTPGRPLSEFAGAATRARNSTYNQFYLIPPRGQIRHFRQAVLSRHGIG